MEEASELSVDSAPEGCYLHTELVVDAGQTAIRIDRFLAAHLENASRTFVQRAIDAGWVLVNGTPVKASYSIKPGELIDVYQSGRQYDTKIEPEDIPLDIVHDDDDILIVNKPAGMVVHPGHGHFHGTLVNALLYYLRENPLFAEGGIRPGLAHRIDKDTSGLIAIGKSERTLRNLSSQFLNKSAHREYLAFAWGGFNADQGTIAGNLGRDPSNRQRMKVFPDGSQGKAAITHWRVEERFCYLTLLRCELETGRMHQIRAHMQWINHPLFGDARYGGDQILRGVETPEYRQFAQRALAICPRQALHAEKLHLRHPASGQEMEFYAPPPADFSQLLNYWRGWKS